jgi:hypothetical protein
MLDFDFLFFLGGLTGQFVKEFLSWWRSYVNEIGK